MDDYNDLRDYARKLEKENERMYSILTNIEWGVCHGINSYCPYCHARKEWGHTDSCKLSSVLKGENK